MRGVEHDGDAGLFVEKELLLLLADVDDAAAAAALFPVDEAARITVGRNAVGVIGMVSIYYGRVWDFSEHRRRLIYRTAKHFSWSSGDGFFAGTACYHQF